MSADDWAVLADKCVVIVCILAAIAVGAMMRCGLLS